MEQIVRMVAELVILIVGEITKSKGKDTIDNVDN